MYLECHITIEPVFDDRLESAKNLAAVYGFKIADLLMKKREEDTETRSKYDTFMTGHGKDLADIENRMLALIDALKAGGYAVWRYKMERIMYDSKLTDTFLLL